MSKGKILLADNNAAFLDTRKELLEEEDYEVMAASNPAEANAILKDTWVHLAIIDLKLTDDAPDDVSGLTLVKETDPVVPKIVLTAYPTWQAVRDALGSGVDGLPPAVDFVAKQDGPEAMIRAVERAFARHVRLDRELNIHWDQQEHLSFLYLVTLLQPDLPNAILVQRADELEDLLRRLFHDYQQIRIGRLLWQDGGRFCLSVLAQSPEGATDSRILVCGERNRLMPELRQMQKLAPKTVEGTKLDSRAETMHFGAATYLLPNADIETIQPLRHLLQIGKERHLKKAFGHLFKVLVGWHQRGQGVEDDDLMSLYRRRVGLEEGELTRTEMERRVEALVQAVRPLSAVEIERGDDLITFHFPNLPSLSCPDPIATIYDPLELYDKPVVCEVSPGQLTADNVLVDAGQQTWLTDFTHAGQAPQWWDFVCLEALVRFDLSQAPDLLAWVEFEECLIAPTRLHDPIRPDVIADLRTSVVLIEQIRRQAGSEVGSDPLPHYTGLLAWAVGAIACYDPTVLYTRAEQMRGAHLLLAAAMLARRLVETPPMSSPEGPLHLDEGGTVWTGDRCVGVLMGQELDLLHCLYEQAGQLVSRQTIVESVFHERYVAGDTNQESRINSLVRRLRVKIEPDPSRPRYILTVKGSGYRLEVAGG
jgi:DNA-binding response OmpR family regulator